MIPLIWLICYHSTIVRNHGVEYANTACNMFLSRIEIWSGMYDAMLHLSIKQKIELLGYGIHTNYIFSP